MKKIGKWIGVLVLVSLLLVPLAAPSAASASGAIRHVSPTGVNTGTCSTWASACNLQRGISVAVSGNQVWVKQGTYKPGTSRTSTFTLKNGVKIYGGFAGSETLLSQRNPAAHVTILSGEIGSAGTSDNSYHVLTAHSGTNNTALVDGFVVTAGNANNAVSPNNYGGGIYIDNANPTLSNMTIRGNSATYGGGMLDSDNSPTLTDLTFSGNSAAYGGAIYNSSSSPTLTDVTLSANTASVGGGAIYGGGAANPTMTNVTFHANSAPNGGALYSNVSSAVIKDGILWGDSSEIYNVVSTLTLQDSVITGGALGTCFGGVTCTNVSGFDPMLAPLANNGGFTKTMSLGAGSSAIDTGGAITTCASKDQRGVPRPQGNGCDIGAYEVKVMTFTSIPAYDGWVLEAAKNGNAGGASDSAATTIKVGDDVSDRRYRGILSFNTTSLPDGARVVNSELTTKQASVVGSPFSTQGALQADLVNAFFGSSVKLVNSDWQAPATVNVAGTFGQDVTWFNATLATPALSKINKKGTTQFRLHFSSDAYNAVADTEFLYSGNASTPSFRPRLMVWYNP